MTPQAIAESLKNDMLSGRLPPGSELQQAALAERFLVSRIPVRDALSILAAEKLVMIRPNRGASVIRLSTDGIAEVFHLRLLIESDCLSDAVTRFSAADLAEVEYQLKRSDLEAGRPGWSVSDWDFHRALYEPAGRPIQIALIGNLRQTCQVHIANYEWLASSTGKWLADHAELVERYRARDRTGALEVLKRHLGQVCSSLTAAMRQDHGDDPQTAGSEG